MKPRLILLLILLMGTSIVFADDDPQTPWPIEEHCVANPTLPPDDWTYSGTLLMSGYAGIHAMQADWDTPHVEAFFSTDARGYPIDGGQLSPDGKWYAVPVGEVFTEVSYNRYWFAKGLRLYSMVDDTELNFDLYEYTYLLDIGGIGAWTTEVVRWVDNESLYFGRFLFRPFEPSVEASSFFFATLAASSDLEVSPDWTRTYGYIEWGQGPTIFDPNTFEIVNDVEAGTVLWSTDSTRYISQQRVDGNQQLSLFDKDGNFIELLFSSESSRSDIRRAIAGRNELGWSPNGEYFAFVQHISYRTSELMLLDFKNQVAINTCLNAISHPVWSPDGMQIAILMNARENLKVVIFDLETWTAYDVARHSGRNGALRPNMLVWRSNE